MPKIEEVIRHYETSSDGIGNAAAIARFVLDLLNAKEASLAGQKLRIKYTDDNVGAASRQLGLPKYAHFGEDAGLDLPVVLEQTDRQAGLMIFPGERVLLRSGIIIEPPPGYWARIVHRSSTERKHRLRVIEGVIDAGYRNEVLTQVHNPNTFPVKIEHGQRIAQLILCHLAAFEVVVADELSSSSRGRGGFGSSGV